MILETVGTEFPCNHGIMYTLRPNNIEYPHLQLPKYFDDDDACCNDGTWLAQWLREIGESIGQKQVFQVYSESLEFFHDN